MSNFPNTGGSAFTKEHSFPFQKLPPEIQREVLRHTDLVHHEGYMNWGQGRQGVYSLHWEVPNFSFPFWGSSLLQVSHAVREMALEIFLQGNRFQFACPFRKTLRVLQQLPREKLSYLRRLDLRFTTFEEDRLREPSEARDAALTDLKALLEFIVTHVAMLRLVLTLGSGVTFVENFNTTKFWKAVVPVLQECLRSPPKRFFVYWDEHPCREKDIERLIMGPDFNSVALGKVPSRWRCEGHLMSREIEDLIPDIKFRHDPEGDGKGPVYPPGKFEEWEELEEMDEEGMSSDDEDSGWDLDSPRSD